MKFSILQETFKTALTTVARSVGLRSTLPVLSNVLLQVKDDTMSVSSTNLESGTVVRLSVKNAEDGAITLPHKLLTDWVNGVPNDRIDVVADMMKATATLKCAGHRATIKGIDAEEYPIIPEEFDTNLGEIDGNVLRAGIAQVVFAAADDNTRPILAGVLFRWNADGLTLAAADGFRLSVKRFSGTFLPRDVIIPARALTILATQLTGDESVLIELAPFGAQVRFSFANVQLVSRTIDGKFPDFERIIPQLYNLRAVIDLPDLQRAIRLATPFAATSANIAKLSFELDEEPSQLRLSVNAAEVGDNVTTLPVMADGGACEVAANIKYLSDCVGIYKSGPVVIEAQNSALPIVLKQVGDDTQVTVLMPMQIRG